MQRSFSDLVSALAAKPRDILAQDDQATTFLVFSPEHGRYVALKVYRRDSFAGELILRRFQENAASLREDPIEGVALPFETGLVQTRFYQVSERLPGCSLEEQISQAGPLSPSAAIGLARRLISIARAAANRPEFRLSWSPAHVRLWRNPGGPWLAGIDDCDFRAPRHPWGDTAEDAAVRGIVTLVRFARGGQTTGPGWFRTWLDRASRDSTALHDLESSLDELPLPAHSDDGVLLEPTVPQWPKLPGLGNLPDCYDYLRPATAHGLPSAYEATDLLRGGPRLVHLLPPERATGDGLEPYLRQATVLTRQRPAEGFLPIDAVMRDPSCRLIAEKPSKGVCLADLLEHRHRLSAGETLAILRALHETISELSRDGWAVPPLTCRDVFLSSAIPGSERFFFGDLSDPDRFRVQVRAFPAHFGSRHLSHLSSLARPGLDILQLALPRQAFAALGFELITTLHLQGEPLPAPVVACFRAVLAGNHALERKHGREGFLNRLEKALAPGRAPVRSSRFLDSTRFRWQPWPEVAGVRAAVGVAAALVLVAACYATREALLAEPPDPSLRVSSEFRSQPPTSLGTPPYLSALHRGKSL